MFKKLFLFFPLLLVFTSCIKEPLSSLDPQGQEELNPSLDFDFEMNRSLALSLDFEDAFGSDFVRMTVNGWDGNPFDEGKIIFSGLTDEAGKIDTRLLVPRDLEELVIEPSNMGLKRFVRLAIESSDISYETQGYDEEGEYYEQKYSEEGAIVKKMAAAPISYMGTYNSQGVPDYLEPQRDVISAQLLSFIDASLPEGKPVPTYHPRYLDEDKDINVKVLDSSDVWITFVHEGAGWKNALGYYTYPTNNPPKTEDDLAQLNIIFPNFSFAGGGGGLRSGDKVHLGSFGKGTSIGFVLFANAWDANRRAVRNGHYRIFSDKNLNPETDPKLRQHNVLLYDDENELFLVGFEDINRESSSCDQDFNDAVFFLTANPITNIDVSNVNPIDKPGDSDQDGVNDVYDEAPNDPTIAYKNYYPSKSSYGTLAFEDLWPQTGDYDFNDPVADYKFTFFLSPQNTTTSMEAEFVLQAIGAGYHNGLAFQMDLSPSLISNLSGNLIQQNYLNFNANGTEAGQSKAVIVVTDDAYNSFEKKGGFVNTQPSESYLTPDTIRVRVEFTRGLISQELGFAPFNPFLIINKNRGKEVHLPSYLPTDLADLTFFGTGEDGSNVSAGIYYKSPGKLPWAMNLPQSFAYPLEGEHISQVHLKFIPWVNSDGFSFMDWYKPISGYREVSKAYSN